MNCNTENGMSIYQYSFGWENDMKLYNVNSQQRAFIQPSICIGVTLSGGLFDYWNSHDLYFEIRWKNVTIYET